MLVEQVRQWFSGGTDSELVYCHANWSELGGFLVAWHWARVLYWGKGSEDRQVMQGCLYAKRREVKKEGNNKGCTSCTSCVSNKWLMLFAGYFKNCFSLCFVVCLSI